MRTNSKTEVPGKIQINSDVFACVGSFSALVLTKITLIVGGVLSNFTECMDS